MSVLELLRKMEWHPQACEDNRLCFHCGQWEEEGHHPTCLLAQAIAEAEKDDWVSVEDGLPETIGKWEVIFTNSYDKQIITLAEYVPYRFILAEDYMSDECDDEIFDYDEKEDKYWTQAGWYEWQYVPEINFYLDEKITHYRKIALPQKEVK